MPRLQSNPLPRKTNSRFYEKEWGINSEAEAGQAQTRVT